MSAKVRIPTPLRQLSAGKDLLEVESTTLGQAINELEASYPGFKDRLCDESGAIRRFVNVYVNGEDVRFLSGPDTAIKSGDEISIVPAVAGGC